MKASKCYCLLLHKYTPDYTRHPAVLAETHLWSREQGEIEEEEEEEEEERKQEMHRGEG